MTYSHKYDYFEKNKNAQNEDTNRRKVRLPFKKWQKVHIKQTECKKRNI